MELKHRLLDHPFYQAWTKGDITLEQLAKYHASYNEFIELMPTYWEKIVKSFNEESKFATEVIEDEREHIALWETWKAKLPQVNSFPRMNDVIEELDKMNKSELLGAIQAFEMQQPEVAETKKEGLMCHYGYEATELKYFDEHMDEEAHIAFGRQIAKRGADMADFQRGFDRGAEIFYNALDKFLN